jgi:hypothetical protein
MQQKRAYTYSFYTAFRNYFEGQDKYPTFKKRRNQQSTEYTTSAFKWEGTRLTLAKMTEPPAIQWSSPFLAHPQLHAIISVVTELMFMELESWHMVKYSKPELRMDYVKDCRSPRKDDGTAIHRMSCASRANKRATAIG